MSGKEYFAGAAVTTAGFCKNNTILIKIILQPDILIQILRHKTLLSHFRDIFCIHPHRLQRRQHGQRDIIKSYFLKFTHKFRRDAHRLQRPQPGWRNILIA